MNRRDFLSKSASSVPILFYSHSLYGADSNKLRFDSRRKINFRGKILINGKPATSKMFVKSEDTIEAIGEKSSIMFSVGMDAFKVSNNAKVILSGYENVDDIEVKSGKLLAVFAKGRRRKITTNNATMGIRGTGVFVDAMSKKKTEFCTCYGKTNVSTNSKNSMDVEAMHHNSLVIEGNSINMDSAIVRMYHFLISPSHTDKELRELEAMVGRVPEFDRNGNSPFIEM